MKNTGKIPEHASIDNIQPAAILPPDAVQMLTQAARTQTTNKNPLARIKAIENTVELVRQRYPKYFREHG